MIEPCRHYEPLTETEGLCNCNERWNYCPFVFEENKCEDYEPSGEDRDR